MRYIAGIGKYINIKLIIVRDITQNYTQLVGETK